MLVSGLKPRCWQYTLLDGAFRDRIYFQFHSSCYSDSTPHTCQTEESSFLVICQGPGFVPGDGLYLVLSLWPILTLAGSSDTPNSAREHFVHFTDQFGIVEHISYCLYL